MRFCVLILTTIITACATITASRSELKSQEEIHRQYEKGNKLVMVTHPDCGFSQRAFQDFSPKIRNYLKTNGVIIAPVSSNYTDEQLLSVVRWNRKSEFKHNPTLADRINEIDLGGTPQFYFFREGNLQERIVGWPKDKSNLGKIEKAIDRLEATASPPSSF